MKRWFFVLLPLFLTLAGCGGLASLIVVDGIRGGDACGEAGLDTCRTRAGTLDFGDLLVSAPGFLTRRSYADGYLFRALESGPVRIGMASSTVDSLLRVYKVFPDESLELLDEDDDAGFGQNAVTHFTAETGQEYLVIATSWGADYGRYRLIYSETLTLFEDSLSVVGPLVTESGRKTAVHLGASAAKSPPHGENQVDGIQEGPKRELDPRTE
jgi:hypothetical protein